MTLKDAIVELLNDSADRMSLSEIDSAVAAAWSEFEDQIAREQDAENEAGDHKYHLRREMK